MKAPNPNTLFPLPNYKKLVPIVPKIFDTGELKDIKDMFDKDKYELSIKKDYTKYIKLENFVLTPEEVGQKNQPNSGHMHLYVNGIKISRVYSNWFHIPGRYFNLEENVIKITLNSNLHDSFTINGNPIESEIKIEKK